MKKLFLAIRHNDIDEVMQIIQANPKLVNCTAKQPTKKDDGQSPLQVALKTGNIEIANYLIDMGANVNFIEDEMICCNEWRAPVIHDAINCAVMSCRWNTNDELMGFKEFSNIKKSKSALLLLKKLLKNGADINGKDSYGNSCLDRFCLQACLILPSYNYVEHKELNNRLFTKKLHNDLKNILIVLKDAGADISYISPNTGKSLIEYYDSERSISKLLKEVYIKKQHTLKINRIFNKLIGSKK